MAVSWIAEYCIRGEWSWCSWSGLPVWSFRLNHSHKNVMSVGQLVLREDVVLGLGSIEPHWAFCRFNLQNADLNKSFVITTMATHLKKQPHNVYLRQHRAQYKWKFVLELHDCQDRDQQSMPKRSQSIPIPMHLCEEVCVLLGIARQHLDLWDIVEPSKVIPLYLCSFLKIET